MNLPTGAVYSQVYVHRPENLSIHFNYITKKTTQKRSTAHIHWWWGIVQLKKACDTRYEENTPETHMEDNTDKKTRWKSHKIHNLRYEICSILCITCRLWAGIASWKICCWWYFYMGHISQYHRSGITNTHNSLELSPTVFL